MKRGEGATSRAMNAAPKGAHYVWVNEHLGYPKDLARRLGRADLVIVSPGWFQGDRWRGIQFKAIVLDHATEYTESIFRAIEYARSRQPEPQPRP